MIKRDELLRGTITRAADDEPVFVLRAQDVHAPDLVRAWAHYALNTGLPRDKFQSALALADEMEQWHTRKSPD